MRDADMHVGSDQRLNVPNDEIELVGTGRPLR
jgi:hypothetical protein